MTARDAKSDPLHVLSVGGQEAQTREAVVFDAQQGGGCISIRNLLSPQTDQDPELKGSVEFFLCAGIPFGKGFKKLLSNGGAFVRHTEEEVRADEARFLADPNKFS